MTIALPTFVTATSESLVQSVVELVRYRELLWNLVARDLKVRYKRSSLGLAWTMLNPLFMMLVFTVVFSSVFHSFVEHFATFFLAGYVLWNFFSQTTVFSMHSLLNNAALLKRIYMPRSIFILATVVAGVLNLLFALIPLFLIMIVTGQRIGPAVLFLPIPILLAAIFALGLSLALSAVVIFFNDVLHVYQVLLTAWLYLTPIIYPIEVVPPRYQWLIRLNPMTYLVEAFREPIYAGALPAPDALLIGGSIALAMLFLGAWIFARSADHFAYYI